MANNLPIAILIDGDNASPEKLNEVIRFATTHGNPIIKRVYADWTKPSSNRWKEVAYETSFRLIEAPSYVSKKNTTDIALVIDAMDILLAGMVKGFCIVSSDSDYTLLTQRIREAGLLILKLRFRLSIPAVSSSIPTRKFSLPRTPLPFSFRGMRPFLTKCLRKHQQTVKPHLHL